MANLLSDPNLWKDDAGNTPPSYWNGTSYAFSSGVHGGPDQYIELLANAPAGSSCSAMMDNLAACTGSGDDNQIVQLLDLNAPNTVYYQNGTDMESIGSWTIGTGTLSGTEKIQFIGRSQFVTSYAYDFTLTPITPPPVPTPPYVRLRWSDDGGHNWSNAQDASMGETGQTAQRVIFRRIGSTRRNTGLDRIFELSSDSDTQVALVGASIGDG
jgi:hypothetical protein